MHYDAPPPFLHLVCLPNPKIRITPKMIIIPEMKMTPKLKTTLKLKNTLIFWSVWKRNCPPYGSFGIGYTKPGIRLVSWYYEVIPKPFQGEHVCCNNSCSNQSIEKILSDSFSIYIAWILGKVSATKSKKKFLHWIQNLSTLYQFWYRGPPIFGIGYTKTGIGWTGFGTPYTSSGNTLTE